MASTNASAPRKGRIYETHTGSLTVEWPTAGKRTYDAIVTVMSRRDGATLPSERLSIYADSTDAELAEARKALAEAHNVVVAEIKRRAEKPVDPRDAAIAKLEAEIAALKAAQATPTPPAKPAATPTPPTQKASAKPKAAAQPKTAEQEMADLPF